MLPPLSKTPIDTAARPGVALNLQLFPENGAVALARIGIKLRRGDKQKLPVPS
jgi:hypothetical protein